MRAAEALAAPCEVTAAVGKGRLAAVQRVRGLTPRVTALPRHARVRRPSLSATAAAAAAVTVAAVTVATAATGSPSPLLAGSRRVIVVAIHCAAIASQQTPPRERLPRERDHQRRRRPPWLGSGLRLGLGLGFGFGFGFGLGLG